MPKPRQLRSAPIAEAVFDFRVRLRNNIDPAVFEQLVPTLSERFPQIQRRRTGQVTFALTPAGPVPPKLEDLGIDGIIFRTADNLTAAQFRLNGFTLNRLAPYTSFNELFPVVLDLWGRYLAIAAPEVVMRIALRYINRFTLPPDHHFDQSLRAPPRLPAELPQLFSAFFTRSTVHDPQRAQGAHIVQALETDAASQTATVILDIDAFSDSGWTPDDPQVLETFKGLREFKNLIFFSMLTEDALRRFE